MPEKLKDLYFYSSSEFAIRPYIARDPERAMASVRAWAQHKNHHVRRLASEGCRPRLPWGMVLTVFTQETPIPSCRSWSCSRTTVRSTCARAWPTT